MYAVRGGGMDSRQKLTSIIFMMYVILLLKSMQGVRVHLKINYSEGTHFMDDPYINLV